MTQASFAEAFRLTPRQVVGLKAGKANPSVKTLARLGKTFGLQVGFVRPHPASSAQHKTEPQNSRLTSEKAAAVASFRQSLGRYGRTYAALTNGAAPNAAPKPASPEAIERSIEAIQASSGSRTPEQEAEITAFLRQIGAA
jgi:transcriptional regulator with XRE-family HTH domain